MNEHNAMTLAEATIRMADCMYPHRMAIVRANVKKAASILKGKQLPEGQTEARPYMLEATKHLEFFGDTIPLNTLLMCPLLYQDPGEKV